MPAAVAELGERLAEGRAEVARAAAAHDDAVDRLARATAQLAGFPPLATLEAAAQAHLRIGKGNAVRQEPRRPRRRPSRPGPMPPLPPIPPSEPRPMPAPRSKPSAPRTPPTTSPATWSPARRARSAARS